MFVTRWYAGNQPIGLRTYGGAEMEFVALVTERTVVDKIVRHLQDNTDSERAPPGPLPETPASSEEPIPAP